MRVVHISSADNSGGAARSAYRLHQALNVRGIDSSMFVKSKFTQDDAVSAYQPNNSTAQKMFFKLRRRWETGGIGYLNIDKTTGLGFAPPTSPSGMDLLSHIPSADIINLHWVSAFFDFRLLPRLTEKCQALVWRFSDMSPFTGGCFYDNYCGRYTESCGQCPCLNSKRQQDLSHRAIEIKKKVISSLPDGFLHIVAQSRWMERSVRESAVFRGIPVTRIANGIDVERFQPIERQVARQKLRLPSDHLVVLFIAQSLSNPMKGAAYFIEAVRKIVETSKKPVLVLVVGEGAFEDIEGAKLVRMSINDDLELNYVYSASDVFVITSMQDTLPNTVLEAMACGTPVVGFEAGGIPDMVENGKSGFVVSIKDSAGLADKIQVISANDDMRQVFSINARERIISHFDVEDQAKSYDELYQSLLASP